MYWDVKTKGNAYLIHPLWGFDRRQSRLNPVMRMWGFDVTLDKLSPSYESVLSDFQQALDNCSAGCNIVEQIEGSYVGSERARRSVVVYPRNPTRKQEEEASGWDEFEPGWLPGIFLVYEGNLISRISFRKFSFTRTQALRQFDTPPKSIGSWTPKATRDYP